PAGQVWRPQNIPEVLSQGAELGVNYKKEFVEWKLGASLNYSYTNVRMIRGLWSEDPSIDEQLAFQPKHSLRSSFTASKDAITGFINLSYTGERTTLDIYDILKPYFLVDVGVALKGVLGGNRYSLNIALKNITNEHYENIKFYAMPGRNWQVALRYFF
ncbi:MAG: TonB-dependent receptor, partial [Bacteroidales bacterium]|nr:TonB-dependent receptor [Bacteroidales bacterium]